MKKYTKLYYIFSNQEEYELCIKLYKFIKQSPQYTLNDLVLYKSIVWKILQMQGVKDEDNDRWVTFKEYVNFLFNASHNSVDKMLNELFLNFRKGVAFRYNKKTDFGKLI